MCTYPGYDELPGVLVVGVNPLTQQRDEAHQVELVALRHDVLQNPSVSEGTSSTQSMPQGQAVPPSQLLLRHVTGKRPQILDKRVCQRQPGDLRSPREEDSRGLLRAGAGIPLGQ